MAIKANGQDIQVRVDPVDISGSIKVIQGNLTQSWMKDTHEYYPDRDVFPCYLIPEVSVVDPEKVMTGQRNIYQCVWYERSFNKDSLKYVKTLITSSTPGYEIITGNASYPNFTLKVKKNFETQYSTEIVAEFSIKDVRTNGTINFVRSVTFSTQVFDKYVLNLKLEDNPQQWIINPLTVTEETAGEFSGAWLQKFTAQLYQGTHAVGFDHAAYTWDVEVDTGDGKLTNIKNIDPDLRLLIFPKNKVLGNWTNELYFDVRFVKEVKAICMAKYYETTKPTSIENDLLKVESQMLVLFPHNLKVQVIQLAGPKMNYKMDNVVSYKCEIYAYNKLLTDSSLKAPLKMSDFFTVNWYARDNNAPGVISDGDSYAESQRPDSPIYYLNSINNAKITDKFMDTLTFRPCNVRKKDNSGPAFTSTSKIKIWAEVKVYNVHALVGAETVENGLKSIKAIVNNNKYIITKTFI